MSLLEQVNHYLARNTECFDILELRLATQSDIAESDIYLGEMRWGHIEGTVLHRAGEYVMVTEYIYNEGCDGGDEDRDAHAVEPHEIVKVIWEAI